MIGSLRQSVLLDLYNSFNHSSFPHFLSCELIYSEFLPLLQTKIHDMNLTQITEIEFAPLLLSDIYNKLETGVTFNAIQHIFSQPPSMIQQFQFLDGEYPVTNQIGEKVNELVVLKTELQINLKSINSIDKLKSVIDNDYEWDYESMGEKLNRIQTLLDPLIIETNRQTKELDSFLDNYEHCMKLASGIRMKLIIIIFIFIIIIFITDICVNWKKK
jgi:hypothetical protein